jgi:hypothetical protein
LPVVTAAVLVLPAATVERLEIPDVTIDGHPDPTDLGVEWQLSADALTLPQASLVDPDEYLPGDWFDTSTIHTGLVNGPAGSYGCWVRITAGDELIVRYAGRVELV